MKIYTKKGDGGMTSLIGGVKVSKHHLRINSYGNVDELGAFTGYIADQINDKQTINFIRDIQKKLFIIGSYLAADPKKLKMKTPKLQKSDIDLLEKEIDSISKNLKPLRSFILSGGHPAVSLYHIARCVCRRAERSVVGLAENEDVDQIIIQYLNRLSDYFFVLARKTSKDFEVNEIIWKP